MDLALLDTVLPLSSALLSRSSCMMTKTTSRLVGENRGLQLLGKRSGAGVADVECVTLRAERHDEYYLGVEDAWRIP